MAKKFTQILNATLEEFAGRPITQELLREITHAIRDRFSAMSTELDVECGVDYDIMVQKEGDSVHIQIETMTRKGLKWFEMMSRRYHKRKKSVNTLFTWGGPFGTYTTMWSGLN